MEKTVLYKDISTGNIYTLQECKDEYAKAKGCELPIDDHTIEMILHENSWQLGGNVQVICDVDDNILNWCNRYADVMEAERYLNQVERDDSINSIYQMIQMCIVDELCMNSLQVNLDLVMDSMEPDVQALIYELINLTKGE